ncbi:hypothetical protein GCM10023321_73480 [Pseudonocardia eucalypti]|uniref:Uncharacterized protein n=1 Tax=Pseudonocardia eucalypti TaxID=648755 RepID=A0ABP9R8V8_9PSEU
MDRRLCSRATNSSSRTGPPLYGEPILNTSDREMPLRSIAMAGFPSNSAVSTASMGAPPPRASMPRLAEA